MYARATKARPPSGRGGSQEGVSMKSQRIALALALLATLDNSVALKGWHGSARLRAYVARAVADLLA